MSQLRRQQGAVSLLTTIIIGILLTIITTGLITLMISELRQSNDAEQSIRAYYAAQSGVEQGIEKVIAALAGAKVDQLCGAAGSQNVNLDPGAPGAVGWTCQQITYSGSPTGSLPVPDKATQLDIGPKTSFNSMVLEWDLTPPPFVGGFFNAPLGNFPAAASGWSYAAPVELAIVDYPSGSFSASAAGAITLHNALVVPRTVGGGTISIPSLKGANPIAGTCNAGAGSYHCRAVFNGFLAGRSYLMRLRTRYVGTDYRLTFYAGGNGNGAVVPVPDGTATIDITAKAGDAFRRVIYKVPYQAGAATGLDYVIYSDSDICKNFGIINGNLNAATLGCPY